MTRQKEKHTQVTGHNARPITDYCTIARVPQESPQAPSPPLGFPIWRPYDEVAVYLHNRHITIFLHPIDALSNCSGALPPPPIARGCSIGATVQSRKLFVTLADTDAAHYHTLRGPEDFLKKIEPRRRLVMQWIMTNITKTCMWNMKYVHSVVRGELTRNPVP